MCSDLAERKLAVVVVGGELLLFEKRVSGLHNTPSTEMKQTGRKGGKERNLDEGRKKQFCEALTDDLTGETQFVFGCMMSDALPVRKGAESAHRRIRSVFFLFSFLGFKTATSKVQ